MNVDYVFKYILVGNSGVGKSSILRRLTNNDFKESHDTTIGAEFGV